MISDCSGTVCAEPLVCGYDDIYSAPRELQDPLAQHCMILLPSQVSIHWGKFSYRF